LESIRPNCPCLDPKRDRNGDFSSEPGLDGRGVGAASSVLVGVGTEGTSSSGESSDAINSGAAGEKVAAGIGFGAAFTSGRARFWSSVGADGLENGIRFSR
jgi:hypothetical protein